MAVTVKALFQSYSVHCLLVLWQQRLQNIGGRIWHITSSYQIIGGIHPIHPSRRWSPWLWCTIQHRTVLTMFPLILQTLSLVRCCSAEVRAHDLWTFNHSHITLQWLPARVETKVTVTKQFIRIRDSQSLTKHDNNTCTGTLSKCAATATKDIRRKETMFTVSISLRSQQWYEL